MLAYPNINPIAIELGPLKVHWYGIMYLVGFAAVWWLGTRRARRSEEWREEEISELVFYGVVGTLLGGRLGYMLFYDLTAVFDDPLQIFKVWQGGMSFHGGLIGVIVAQWLFAPRS